MMSYEDLPNDRSEIRYDPEVYEQTASAIHFRYSVALTKQDSQ